MTAEAMSDDARPAHGVTPAIEPPEWHEMWDIQYDLTRKIDVLLNEAYDGYPPEWRAMGCTYVAEHLMESARLGIELRPRSTS